MYVNLLNKHFTMHTAQYCNCVHTTYYYLVCRYNYIQAQINFLFIFIPLLTQFLTNQSISNFFTRAGVGKLVKRKLSESKIGSGSILVTACNRCQGCRIRGLPWHAMGQDCPKSKETPSHSEYYRF